MPYCIYRYALLNVDVSCVCDRAVTMHGRHGGDAENARHEIAVNENAAPECKGGKCET